MRKYTHILVSLLLAIGALTAYGRSHEVEIVDEYGVRIPNASIVGIRILIPDSDTNATIYKEGSLTNAITQPITASSTNTTLVTSVVRWYGLDPYDIIVRTTRGNEVRRRGNNSSNGTVVVPTVEYTRNQENIFIDFKSQPLVLQEDATVSSGVDTEIMVMALGGGAPIMEYININTQTLLAPNITATGLDIALDLTDTDGAEYGFGILNGSPGHFTVGTDLAFYMRAKITITDVSGTDDFAIGWRKVEAYQAAVDDYDEMAAFNIISGDIYTETIINGASTVSTDTTNNWADLATKTIQVNVSAAGVVTYTIDGLTPTTTVAYTFDDAEEVVPFIYFIHDANLAETTILQTLEVGLL